VSKRDQQDHPDVPGSDRRFAAGVLLVLRARDGFEYFKRSSVEYAGKVALDLRTYAVG